jgi:6,7-dimethyl-8-ribityllumazine synthase
MSLLAPAPTAASGAAFRVGIAAARYNERLVEPLLEHTVAALVAAGVKQGHLAVVRVPGSNELPSAAQLLAARRPDVIIALGVIIRGETIHYELIAHASAQGLQRVALDAHLPVINGIVVGENEAQAAARTAGGIDRGAEFAAAALEMAALGRRLKKKGRA